jgi:fructose-1,6-bisphosphatase
MADLAQLDSNITLATIAAIYTEAWSDKETANKLAIAANRELRSCYTVFTRALPSNLTRRNANASQTYP